MGYEAGNLSEIEKQQRVIVSNFQRGTSNSRVFYTMRPVTKKEGERERERKKEAKSYNAMQHY